MRRSITPHSVLLFPLVLSLGCFDPGDASQSATDDGSSGGSSSAGPEVPAPTSGSSNATTGAPTTGTTTDPTPDEGSSESGAATSTGTTAEPGSTSAGGGESESGEGDSTGEPVVVDADLYVDAAAGDDANDGSLGAPVATISHAMTLVDTGETVAVFPGLYDQAHGESFPIEVPATVTLIGDAAGRGGGDEPTTISGHGAVEGDFEAAVVPGVNTEIRGFTIVGSATLLHFGVFVETNAILAENTYGPGYGGVRLAGGDPVIEQSTFETGSYGVYGCFGTGTIHDNHFVTPALNVDLQGAGPCTVSDNLIEGTGQVGIQNQGGDHVITGNTFEMPNGYTYGCLSTSGASLVQDNVCNVNQGDAIRILDGGSPNLGTPLEPGNNVLGGLNAVGVHTLGNGSVTARGNTWAAPTPICDVQIVNEGETNVWWGDGPQDYCG